ncbi:MAG: hypothetical protein D6813_01100, partial [Calditrichaeota bacterium]
MKRELWIIAMLLAALGLFNASLQAQGVDVLVTPDEIQLDVGESTKIEVFAFTSNKTPVKVDSIKFSVHPDSMGTITPDGFFIAGKHSGEAEIEAVIYVGNLKLRKLIKVLIGKLPPPRFKVVVEPEKVVVPTGTEQQFKVFITTRHGERIRPKHVRWKVRPESLGKIDETGLFVAGEPEQQGKVIAIVDFDNLTLRGSAKVTVSPPATGAISGNVISDNDGTPLVGAHVKAVRLGKIHWVQKSETDDSGNYFVGDLIPGIYVVYANARGFIGEFYDNTRNFLEATPLNIAEEDTVGEINFSLSKGAKITGTIYTATDSSLLAHTHVQAILVVNRKVISHAISDENGFYQLESLPTGTYVIKADAAGFKKEFYDDKKSFGEADFISVTEPDSVGDIDFALAQASAITGLVTDNQGNPIAGAKIQVFSAIRLVARLNIRRLIVKETRTNENGEYVAEVRPGLYFVHASAEGFNGQFYDHAQDFLDAKPVRVVRDSHTTDINFELIPRSSISGNVKDEVTGEPIAEATVLAFPENRRILDLLRANDRVGFRTKTDENGNYVLENIPAGKYLVVAEAENYLPEFWEEADNKKDATPIQVEPGIDVENINFTLIHGGSISGLVASEVDSVGIAGALVVVTELHTKFHRRTFTEEDGTYKVEGLPSGDYLVHVVARGFFPEYFDDARNRRQATPVTVNAPDETAGINVYLKPFKARGGTIAGRVVVDDEDQTPIAGAIIIAVERNHVQPQITFTDSDGNYELTNLRAGRYFVFAWADGFIGEFYDDAKVFQDADLVKVIANHVTDNIDFALTPEASTGIYAVSGRITSAETGEGVEGVMVQALLGDEIEVTTVTDENGNYVLDNLPAGTYTIAATGLGFQTSFFGGDNPDNALPVTVGNGNDAENVNLNLQSDNVTSVGGSDNTTAIPDRFELFQNYPNPFNPETT